MAPDRQVLPVVWPIGMLDPDRQVGYLSSIHNGIDALDLQDGRRLWTTADASIPLLLGENWLIAQILIPDRSNIIQIAKLDLADMGRTIWISEPIVFPDWVIVERSPCYGHNCQIRVSADGTDLYLEWQAQNYYKGGAPPPPEILAMYDQQAEGRVRLDLDCGKLEILPAVAQTVTPSNDPDLDRRLASGWWISGQNLVFLTTEYLRVEQVRKLELITCSVDLNLRSERTIELIRARELTYFTTVDRRYLLLSTDPYPDERSWSIFSTETGELLQAIECQLRIDSHWPQAMSIFKGKIYLLFKIPNATPGIQNILAVKDFHTGASLWEYQLVEEPVYPLPC